MQKVLLFFAFFPNGVLLKDFIDMFDNKAFQNLPEDILEGIMELSQTDFSRGLQNDIEDRYVATVEIQRAKQVSSFEIMKSFIKSAEFSSQNYLHFYFEKISKFDEIVVCINSIVLALIKNSFESDNALLEVLTDVLVFYRSLCNSILQYSCEQRYCRESLLDFTSLNKSLLYKFAIQRKATDPVLPYFVTDAIIYPNICQLFARYYSSIKMILTSSKKLSLTLYLDLLKKSFSNEKQKEADESLRDFILKVMTTLHICKHYNELEEIYPFLNKLTKHTKIMADFLYCSVLYDRLLEPQNNHNKLLKTALWQTITVLEENIPATFQTDKEMK
jgi:hypothetical protein